MFVFLFRNLPFPLLLVLEFVACCVVKIVMVSHAIILVEHLYVGLDAILDCEFPIFVIFVLVLYLASKYIFMERIKFCQLKFSSL